MNSAVGGLQRASPIVGLASLLREFGVDPDDVGRGLDVDLTSLRPNDVLPYQSVAEILRRASEATDCEHFGLLLGSRYDWSKHGPLHALSSRAATLGEALVDFTAWQGRYSTGGTVYLHRHGDEYALGYGIYDRASPATRQIYDLCLAIGCNMVRDLTSGAVAPIEALWSCRPPADPEPWRRILKIPVRFNQHQSCLVISAAAMACKLPRFDPEARAKAMADMSRATAMGAAFSERVRHIIRPQLLRDDPTMVSAAAALGLNPRTLRRKLAAEGLTFEAVRDEVRFVLACELLEVTDLPIGEISAVLAFGTHPAFVRAFRRWSGMTPQAWRMRPR